MKRLVLSVLVILMTLSSCEMAQDKLHRGHIVARIGFDVLYSTDLEGVIPSGTSEEDSVALANRYIDSWALSRLLTLRAEKELSKSDKDVSSQVEEFRNNLLGYRYEKFYIESRLDTVVTLKEMEEYYEAHSNNFTAQQTLLKGRAITVLTKSPFYEAFKSSYQVTDESAIAELNELCRASAERYTDFNGGWVPVSVFSKEVGMDVAQFEKLIAGKSAVEAKESGMTRFIFITDRIPQGAVTPLEYNEEHIREIIISKRKQDILSGMERDLLNDAKVDKTLRIYE